MTFTKVTDNYSVQIIRGGYEVWRGRGYVIKRETGYILLEMGWRYEGKGIGEF